MPVLSILICRWSTRAELPNGEEAAEAGVHDAEDAIKRCSKWLQEHLDGPCPMKWQVLDGFDTHLPAKVVVLIACNDHLLVCSPT